MGDFEASLPVTDLDSFLQLRQLPGRWGGEDSDGGGSGGERLQQSSQRAGLRDRGLPHCFGPQLPHL